MDINNDTYTLDILYLSDDDSLWDILGEDDDWNGEYITYGYGEEWSDDEGGISDDEEEISDDE